MRDKIQSAVVASILRNEIVVKYNSSPIVGFKVKELLLEARDPNSGGTMKNTSGESVYADRSVVPTGRFFYSMTKHLLVCN